MRTVEDYLSKVPDYHAEQPRFMAELGAVLECMVSTRDVVLSMPREFDLDFAVGAQLDAVGVRIGRSRNVQINLPGFFSWDTDGLGWDQANWLGPFQPSTGVSALDDDSYRTLLRARALANGWDGSTERMAEIYATLFAGRPYTAKVVDNQDMTMTVHIIGPEPDVRTRALIEGGYLGLNPGAVAVSYVFSPS